jgi:bifunctional DNA-binding transcriptional regulator/antitoxin component of YhaV-PrlF toxin-antitoxin module
MRDDEETALVEIDARGRVQIPLALRKTLGIETGDILRLKVSISKAKNEMSRNPQIAQAPARELVFA